MDGKKKFLTVAPFECAWCTDFKFREPGRGCVSFEAYAGNDVTVVFREQLGGQHYHYRMDTSPHYTVILGSHRNKRLKIVVDGKTVVDEAGVGLCCSSAFQSYWISIDNGLISVGNGQYPFQDMVFQWLDSNPNCAVQYVGLCSWDKHVGYRNVNVWPLTQNCVHGNHEEVGNRYYEDGWGLEHFLENWDLSDMYFVVGAEEKIVPAHKVILSVCSDFSFSSTIADVILLPEVSYQILHAFLQYIYAGRTHIAESQLASLRDLSLQLECTTLTKQCEASIVRLKRNALSDSSNQVEISHSSFQRQHHSFVSYELPIDADRLKQLLSTGEYSDVNVYVDDHGFFARSHKVILSLWSLPFTKMFTNGMSESNSSEIWLRNVPLDVLTAMLQFMYSGVLHTEDTIDSVNLVLQLLMLADQYGISPLREECCKSLLNCLCEDPVCSILQVVSSVPSCKLLQETCERKFSMHFDYCTTASMDYIQLDDVTFGNILQHPDLTVTSEEKVLEAILLWCTQAKVIYQWEAVDEMLKSSTTELLFGERLHSLSALLEFVRFPLMPLALLKKLESSSLTIHLPKLRELVMEAICYSEFGSISSGNNVCNSRYLHRMSNFRELQYICNGDNNGVIYFAGTSYGEHQWVNPVLAKKIVVTASSPVSRYTDPKALVSRTYQGTSYAGPQIEDGKKSTWWMVDIGKDHQLMCNYYTMRQDSSTAYVRSWTLEGSLDGHTWTNLRKHENDQTIVKPGQFASWPVNDPASFLPFRFFRVSMTGPTTSEANPWNLCICFFELYGYFH